MSNPAHDLYRASVAADDAFSDALIAEYGVSAAGLMRYKSDRHPSHIRQLADAAHAAQRAWSEANADPLAGLNAAVARVTRPAKVDEIDTTE